MQLQGIEHVWQIGRFEQRVQLDMDLKKQRLKRNKDWLSEDIKFYQKFYSDSAARLQKHEGVDQELKEILHDCSEELRDNVKSRIEATRKEIEKDRKLVNTHKQHAEKSLKEFIEVERLEKEIQRQIGLIRNQCAVRREKFRATR